MWRKTGLGVELSSVLCDSLKWLTLLPPSGFLIQHFELFVEKTVFFSEEPFLKYLCVVLGFVYCKPNLRNICKIDF